MDRKKQSSRALWLMAALTLAFSLGLTVWHFTLLPRDGSRRIDGTAMSAEELAAVGTRVLTEDRELLPGERININTAGAEELALLPGIGENLSQAIVEYREVHGSFTALEQLMEVSGIGEKKYAGLLDRICLD